MKRNAVFALTMAMLLTGCTALLTPIPVTHLASLDLAAYDTFPHATTLVIRDQASWQTLWVEMTQNMLPAPPLPTVDFSKDMVLVAAAGVGGWGRSIEIAGAGESPSGEVVVAVTITSPGKGCVVPQVITSPVDIATIPRSDANVVFKTTIKEHNCS